MDSLYDVLLNEVIKLMQVKDLAVLCNVNNKYRLTIDKYIDKNKALIIDSVIYCKHSCTPKQSTVLREMSLFNLRYLKLYKDIEAWRGWNMFQNSITFEDVVRTGNIRNIKWFKNNYSIPYDFECPYIFNQPIKDGRINVLNLLKKSYTISYELWKIAAQNNNIRSLKWLHLHKNKTDKNDIIIDFKTCVIHKINKETMDWLKIHNYILPHDYDRYCTYYLRV
jgi:hypothetical protein